MIKYGFFGVGISLRWRYACFRCLYSGKPEVVKEGKEDNPFWNVIGGQEKYYTGPYKKVKHATTTQFSCRANGVV